MKRVLSGVQPTGEVHIGNYFGAFSRWAKMQTESECLFLIVDLHSLTVPEPDADIGSNTLHVAKMLMACGVTPDRSLIFIQSQVPQHAELCWILMCHAAMGELSRMTQYKDRSIAATESARHVGAGIFTYPVLMASDIALYDATDVPVGDDQRQHVELARDIIARFNGLHGPALKMPRSSIGTVGARVMDLQNPGRKMSKSSGNSDGIIYMRDPPDVVARKIRSAKTDSIGRVRYDPAEQPGVANLLGLLSAMTGQDPHEIASDFSTYGTLKEAVTASLVAELQVVQERFQKLPPDQHILDVLSGNAVQAQAIANETMHRVRSALRLVTTP